MKRFLFFLLLSFAVTAVAQQRVGRSELSRPIPMGPLETVIPDAEKKGFAVVTLEAHDVWGDGTGYQVFLDSTATQFGVSIPEMGPLVYGCDVPADLLGKFTHRIPYGTILSCELEPQQMVVDGMSTIRLPVGVYDYCVTNPQPGVNIWIAGGELARGTFHFEVMNYYIRVSRLGDGDTVEIHVPTSPAPDATDEPLAGLNVYGIEGAVRIETSSPVQVVLYDLYGRHCASQRVDGEATLDASPGVYLLQAYNSEGSRSVKVQVK